MEGKLCLVLILLAVCCSYCAEPCPIWMHQDDSDPQHKCVCSSAINRIVQCYDGRGAFIQGYYCMFFSEEMNKTLVGSCPFGDNAMLSGMVSDLKSNSIANKQCKHLYRKGRLCGECDDNYTLPVYSYFLGCVQCDDFKYGWIKFIAVAFLPVTVFYLIVIVFRISTTSSTLNGFILVSQILATPPMVRDLYSGNQINPFYHVNYLSELWINLTISVYTVWNLDFFRSFYKSICVHPNLTYPQVLLLDYAVAVYPMLLIVITFILVKLHDNFILVTKLWMPIHRCLVVFRKQWNIRSSLVNALATFTILSYVKILNVSFELLIPSRVYDIHGDTVPVPYLYYNGSIIMTSKQYLPYLTVAIFMLLVFNILPLLLFALYPFNLFQKLLSCFSNQCKLSLQIFMDSFHGCYKHTSRHYQHFATLYLAVRFLNLLLYSIFGYALYLPSASLLTFFTLALVAKFKPYKNERSNTVDIIFLLVLPTAYISMLMYNTGPIIPKWVNAAASGISLSVPPIIMVYLLLASVSPKIIEYITKCRSCLFDRLRA